MRYFYLYKIINKINNNFYYGVHQTLNLNDNYMGSGFRLRDAYNKYGKQNFKKIILEWFDTESEMYRREKEIVNYHLVESSDCYNLREGGYGGSISRIGIKTVGMKGEKHPFYNKKRPEHSERMKGVGNPRYGKFCSESTKQKISKANRGRKHSEEVNKSKGRSGSQNAQYGNPGPNLGKHWITNGIEEKSVFIDDTFIMPDGWKRGSKSKNTKKVLKLDPKSNNIIAEYKSIAEACKHTTARQPAISMCCAGKLQTSGGFKWRFAEE